MLPTTTAGRERWLTWFIGLVIGLSTGTLLLTIGVVGIAVLVLGIVVLLRGGPRMYGVGGFLTGFGLVWTVLFVNVKMNCATLSPLPGETCTASDTNLWLVGSVGILFVGLLLTFGFGRARGSGSSRVARR
jgi:hypothetical protein